MSVRRAATLITVILLTACAGDRTAEERMVEGECTEVFGGDVCAWGLMTGDQLMEFGVTVPMAMVDNAPADAEMLFPPPNIGMVPMPAEVASATGFSHLSMNWEAHGHPPALFLTPHFDFHFYTIDPATQMAMDCSDLSKPTELAAGYTLPDMELPGLGTLIGLCVPEMGMHSMLESELDDTDLFGASMIVGYYKQDLIFLEPMVAQAKLQEASSFAMEVPDVPNLSEGVTWPTAFEAVYDEPSNSYRFTFSVPTAE